MLYNILFTERRNCTDVRVCWNLKNPHLTAYQSSDRFTAEFDEDETFNIANYVFGISPHIESVRNHPRKI